MGCWNKTCGLTNLPIFHGEEVYVFPIIENDDGDSLCYSTALWKPVLTPFIAEYNDYGDGENASGMVLPMILEGIKNVLVETEIGENASHDIAVKRDDFGIDLFFESTRERRLFIKEYGSQPQREVNYVMMRKDFVDAIWSDYKFNTYTGKGKGLDPTNDYDRDVTFARLADTLPSFVDALFQNTPTAEDALTDEEFAAKWMASASQFDPVEITEKRRIVNNTLRMLLHDGLGLGYDHAHPLKDTFRRYGSTNSLDIFRMQDTLTNMHDAGETDQVIELLRLALIGHCVSAFLSKTRKAWSPTLHEGSQSEGQSAYRFLTQGMINIMDARNNEA